MAPRVHYDYRMRFNTVPDGHPTPPEASTTVRRTTLEFGATVAGEPSRESAVPVSAVQRSAAPLPAVTPPPRSKTRPADFFTPVASPTIKAPEVVAPTPAAPRPEPVPTAAAGIALDARLADLFARYATASHGLRALLLELERLIPRTSETAVLRMLADKTLCEVYGWASQPRLGLREGARLRATRDAPGAVGRDAGAHLRGHRRRARREQLEPALQAGPHRAPEARHEPLPHGSPRPHARRGRQGSVSAATSATAR